MSLLAAALDPYTGLNMTARGADGRNCGIRPPGTGPRIVAAALLLLTMTAGCEGSGATAWEFEGQVSRSTFWEYHNRVDEPLCPTLLDLLDEHARAIGGKIGLTAEENRPLRYYRFEDQTDLASGCPVGATGCTQKDAVLATVPFYAHEQVHTYVYRAWYWSVGLLVEGEAVALSCSPAYIPLRGFSPRDLLGVGDWRPFLYLHGNSNSGYSAAGFWITYLARQYGWQKVEELHRRVLPGTSADDLAIEFARVFPISMDQAWSEALSGNSPPCDSGWACSATTSMSAGDVARPDCDGELHRSIEISGQLGAVLTHRDGILLRNCGDATAPVYELEIGKNTTTDWASLPPGTYAISGAPTPTDDSPSVEVTFVSYLPSPLFAAACGQAGKVTLHPGQTAFVDLLAETADGWLRLDGGDAQYDLAFDNMDFAASGSAALCESCDPGAACVPLPAFGSKTVTIGTGAVLRLQNAKPLSSDSRPWGKITFYPPLADAGS